MDLMLEGFQQVKRLRGRSMTELRVRARQELAKLGERLFGMSEGEMTDRAFLRHVKSSWVLDSAEATAASIINRVYAPTPPGSDELSHSFFPSLRRRDEVVALMRRQFPQQQQDIIEKAEKTLQGRFDLMGFRNLSFGEPADWLLEPISSKRASLVHWSKIKYLDPSVAGDKKITWELNRHQHFVTLGQAYWLTKDEKYAESFISQATSWMNANPAKRGINWVSSLELALRSISWLWALHLFAGSSRLTPQFELRLLKNLVAHGLHLQDYLSHYFSPNTHLTGEALGLYYLGIALPELRCADTWKNVGVGIMLDELSRQIRSDGVYFEQATYYHRYTADFYTHLLILARACKIALPAEVEEKLAKMMTHLMWITRPDGSSPLVGDDDGGRLVILGVREPDDFRDTLATGAALYGRGDWKRVAGRSAVETLWLLGPDGLIDYEALESSEPDASSTLFRESGIAVMRGGWSDESSYVLMDCGPHGSLACGHAHADALSIEISALGKPWIIDPGTFTYTADPKLRDWFRSTHAHNTVTVDDKSQSVTAGPFSWNHIANTELGDFIIGDGFDYLAGSHDGYERLRDPVRHTRFIINPKATTGRVTSGLLPAYLIVRDAFSASETHNYAIRYHLAPGCSAFAVDNQVTVTRPGGKRLHIAVFGSSRLRAQITKSWASRAYGQCEPSVVVTFEARETGPQEFTTLIIPAYEAQAISIDRHPTDFAGASGYQVISESVRDVLLINSAGRPVKCGPLTAASEFAWARFNENDFARGFLIRGHRLETSDGFAFRAAAPVDHCSFRRTPVGIAGSIEGGAVFDIVGGEQTWMGQVNSSCFEVSWPGSETAGSDSNWSVVDNASEAIN
jgi:hypothetical protein